MKNFKIGDFVLLKNVPKSWGIPATVIYQIVVINGSKVKIGHPSVFLKANYECHISDIAPIEINDRSNMDKGFYLHDRELMMPTRAPFGEPKENREDFVWYLNNEGTFEDGKTIQEVIDEAGCQYVHELQRALMNEKIMGKDCFRYELNFNILLFYNNL